MLTLYCIFPRGWRGKVFDFIFCDEFACKIFLCDCNTELLSFSRSDSLGFSATAVETLSIPVFSFHFIDHPTPGSDMSFSPLKVGSGKTQSVDESTDSGAGTASISFADSSFCGGSLTDGLIGVESSGITLSKTGVAAMLEL